MGFAVVEIDMNASAHSLQNVEHINASFLAAKASEAIARALEHQALTIDQKFTLKEASQFLGTVSNGALLASGGAVAAGVSPSRSIAALDFAFGPIGALKRLAQQDDLAKFFSSLSDSIAALEANGDAAVTPHELLKAQQFFDALHEWLAEELTSRRPIVGRRSTGRL